MASGDVVAQNHNTSGNIVGRAHTISILDTRMNQVEFVGGKGTESTANIIAE